MKGFLFVAALAACAAAFAADYRLDLGTSVRGGSLKVEPHITGPAGKALRYEMVVTRESQGGRSNSRQSGSVRLDERGAADLASNAVSVNPGDKYRVEVRVFEAYRLVAQESARHP
jgi:hypothetical protein